ncbi:hypothetical protein [Micromonospora sp. Mcm103]|uniref:hypothetical protein n=1 Tax=Micromonospora sp. Mcm103 TaxID=2926015 RepID=UPI0021C62967|nr:hypothetical protein [Micromonospora sp. Mcm103]
MLNVRYVYAEHDVSQGKFRQYIAGMLDHETWRPAALTADRSFAQMAGLPDSESIGPLNTRYRRGSGVTGRGTGDVFFRPGALVFITNVREPRRPEDRFNYEIMESSPVFGRVRLREGILVGIVSRGDVDIDEALQGFLQAFENQAEARVDEKLEFDWTPIDLDSPRLEKLLEKLNTDTAAARFSTPDLNDEALRGASVLSGKPNRELLRELSEAGFGRVADILARRGDKKEEVQSALAELAQAGLTHAEVLLVCKATSAPLARFSEAEEVKSEPIASVRCGKCPRTYSQELVSEGYSVSPLGRSLAQGSHWMTVWVTSRLVDLGIPLTSIVWNLEDSGEEVDIIIEFMGKLWIFELKDREFGPGDAHPFNYRRVRYGADEAFVITTDKVSADARRVFGDLASGRAGTTTPIIIEGLENVEKEIRKRLEAAYLIRALEALVMPSLMVGYKLDAVAAEWLPSNSIPSSVARRVSEMYYYY